MKGKYYLEDKFLLQIEQLGTLWKTSSNNPKVPDLLISKWDDLIEKWANDSSLPLVVRKSGKNRGKIINHKSKRKIIMTDNSFSHWIYYQLLENNKVPSIKDIRKMLKEDTIPFVYIIPSKEKNKYDKKTQLGKYSLNKKDFKLCHKTAVGMHNKQEISKINIDELKTHFLNLAKPSNMFVIPSCIGGLGEIREFINQQ